MDYIIIILLVGFSGLFSGLTLGLLGLNKTELERKIRLKDKDAQLVYSVRKQGNLLLCTLLLGNVAVNSALSIFLGSIAGGIMAGLTATGLIVVFGEIIPQAVCNRYALRVGAKTAWLVKFFIFILYPICWPLSWVLNKMLGKELPTIWSRAELKEIIKLHEASPESKVDRDEEQILLGALSYSDKVVADILTPRTVVSALEVDTVLNAKVIKAIRRDGFTRIPVYKDQIDNILGMLYVKDLMGMNIGAKVKEIYRKNDLLIISRNKKLDDLLNEFKEKRTHLAFVQDEHGGLEGIVTLEDVVEEIIGSEIVDETDTVIDMRKKAQEKGLGKMQILSS